jgi:hypothetical protein
VVDGNAVFLSDWDIMVIVDDEKALPSLYNAKLAINTILQEKSKKGEIDVQIDFGFIKRSDLPSIAHTLFWFDCCDHALLIWGETNPLDQIRRPERLHRREGIALLANRALGQLFILPAIINNMEDLKKAVYHCGKIPLDGINTLRIVAGTYVPGSKVGENEIDGLGIPSSDRDSIKDIVDAAYFWDDQKRNFNLDVILEKFGHSIIEKEPSPLGVWLWAAQTFHTIWKMVMKVVLKDDDLLKTAQEVLIQEEGRKSFKCVEPWKKFLASSSQHRVEADCLDRMRIFWRATPLAAAHLCGVIGLCYNPWENIKELQDGLKVVKKYLPCTKMRGLKPEEQWIHFVDDSISIWRMHVNNYDERNVTLWNYKHQIMDFVLEMKRLKVN